MSTMSGARQSQTQAMTYDFTKRKRWADILLTGLVDNIPFILSVAGKILYCGNAVTELLGWRDVELLDINFIQLLDPTDQARFLFAFNQSLQTSAEFNILIRMRHSELPSSLDNPLEQKYILFDMKCYPHVTSVDNAVQTRCFFAMAVPYPSRNTAMIDTILDLKAENYRLQHLVAESRASLAPDGLIPKQNPSTAGSSIYATSSLHSQNLGSTRTTWGEPSGPYIVSSTGHEAVGMTECSITAYKSGSGRLGDLTEEGSKKKKPKRTHSFEQYVCVTCGKTDSPEWRKGPAGPKTLCNACGLRWAKQMRKIDEPTDVIAPVNGGD